MYRARAHSLRLDPQRPIVEFNEPVVSFADVSMQFESPLGWLREWMDTPLNALLRHAQPPTCLPPRKIIEVLRQLSFTVYAGESIAIIGEQGAGKTTVLKLIAKSLAPSRGTIQTRGRVSPILNPLDAAALSASDSADILLIDHDSRQPLTASCADLISRSAGRDATIILATDDQQSICNLCTRALWLSDGTIRCDDFPQETVAQLLAARQQE